MFGFVNPNKYGKSGWYDLSDYHKINEGKYYVGDPFSVNEEPPYFKKIKKYHYKMQAFYRKMTLKKYNHQEPTNKELKLWDKMYSNVGEHYPPPDKLLSPFIVDYLGGRGRLANYDEIEHEPWKSIWRHQEAGFYFSPGTSEESKYRKAFRYIREIKNMNTWFRKNGIQRRFPMPYLKKKFLPGFNYWLKQNYNLPPYENEPDIGYLINRQLHPELYR